MELRDWEMVDDNGNAIPLPQGVTAGAEADVDAQQAISQDVLNFDSNQAIASPAIHETSQQPDDLGEGSSRGPVVVADDRKDIMPAAIGRETCPICIMDFEEGDDLRLLPCEGKHRFHQTCVDPWLLQLSSSCPICRQGEGSAFCTCGAVINSAFCSRLPRARENAIQFRAWPWTCPRR